MEIYFSTLLTTDQSELITAALAIAHHVALQSPSDAARDFLAAYHHAIVEDEIFEPIDIACGHARASRIVAGLHPSSGCVPCACEHAVVEGA